MNAQPQPKEDEARGPGLDFQKFKAGTHGRAIAIAGIVLGVYLLSVAIVSSPTASIAKAKQATGMAIAVSLESAINRFYTEYGSLPDGGNQVATDTPEGVKLLVVLLGLEGDSAVSKNKQAVRFLSVKEGSNKEGGLIYDASGKLPEGLYDPWGNSYTVVLDADYDEKLHFNLGTQDVELKGRRVAVFSPGPDKKLGTADDVKTW